MFLKRTNSNPLDVPLGDLLMLLRPTTIKASLKGNALLARHEHYTTRVEVVPPATRETEDGPIKAVVRITTELPKQLSGFFKKPEATVAMNRFAALGALFSDGASTCIGSRLTIYEAENAWGTLHLPLLLFTTIMGAEAILGAVRRTFNKEPYVEGDSAWTQGDFEQVETRLSRVCVCTTGELGLTAEFGLSKGAVTAVAGHHTALLQLKGDQPHPELGGGLFLVLEMPHQLHDEKSLSQLCMELNKMEMAAADAPPHFGAWCEGKLGSNPAYVSFFPNAFHEAREVSAIAVNAAFWAANRAQWANRVLASLGVRA
jgi:hypothetical protein